MTAPITPTTYEGELTPAGNGSFGSSGYLFYDVNFTLPLNLPDGTIVEICGYGENFPSRPANLSMPAYYLQRYSCATEMVRNNLVVAFL